MRPYSHDEIEHEVDEFHGNDYTKKKLKGLWKKKRAIELASGYHKDWKSIVDGLRKNTKFPPPVIVRDKLKNLYLLGGNTRLMLGTAMGYNLPVKIVDFKKEIQ
jgi:hypothetical protein